MARARKRPEFTSSGKAVAYLRVSTGMQAASGLGLMSQGGICARKAAELDLQFRDNIHFDQMEPPRPGYFVDAGESAFRVPFEKRPAGEKVLQSLNLGDTVIVSRLDRAFRNVVDFIEVSGQLIARGNRLVVGSPPIDLGSATGRMLARHLANLAEWESDRKGERIKAGLAVKKSRNSTVPARATQPEESLPSEYRSVPRSSNSSTSDQKPGRIFIYIRCSHRDSAESGLGLLAQLDIARKHAHHLIASNPNLELKDVFTDAAVSATTYKLRNRDAGRKLNAELRDDDHIIFSTIDRGFRNVADMAETLPEWSDRGIHVHFAGEGLSMDDPAGRMMANIIVVFAQLEAELGQDRSREARAQLASSGRFCGGREPPFWRISKSKGEKKLVLCRKRILAFRLINFLRHHREMSLREALIRCEELHAQREKRLVIPLTGVSPRTPMSVSLPKHYERDSRGRAFPMFTAARYNSAKPVYDEAIANWRKIVQTKRELTRAALQFTGE